MLRTCLLVLCLTVVGRVNALAQATPSHSFIVGASAAAYQTTHPEGGIVGLGASLGVERDLKRQVAVRGVATLLRGIRTVDDIALCHLQPDESCLPDSVFPLTVASLEVQLAVAPFRGVPLRLVTGAGVARASEPRESARGAPKLPLKPNTQATWRGGVEVPLGRSSRAPRLSLTRTGFAQSPFSLTHVDAVTVLFRP